MRCEIGDRAWGGGEDDARTTKPAVDCGSAVHHRVLRVLWNIAHNSRMLLCRPASCQTGIQKPARGAGVKRRPKLTLDRHLILACRFTIRPSEGKVRFPSA